MPIEKISFAGHDGQTLAARLDRPIGRPRAYALFAHCFTCSKDLAAARRIAAALADSGIAVLRFDFTGLGHSQGEFGNTNFSTNVEDLALAAAHMRATLEAPTILIGHSLGGAAVIAAARHIPEAKAVVTIGAPAEPGHVTHNLGSSLEEIEREGRATVSLAGRSFTISRQFVEDVRGQALAAALGGLRKALLVLHAPRDATVGIDNASAIFLAAKHPKSFVTLDEADHLLTRAEDAEYAASVIAAWVSRYLPPQVVEHPVADEGVVRVSEDSAGGLLQHVSVDGRFRLIADEPLALGGSDLGPTPYQFLSVALGACTAMTLRMYARRKTLALESVVVDVSHDKVHAADSDDAEAGAHKRVDRFRREIALTGDLTPAERARLIEIADMCPVHRTLEQSSRVETVERG